MKRQLLSIGFATISILSASTSPLLAQTTERTVNVKVIKAYTQWLDTFDTLVTDNELPDFYIVPTIDGQQFSRSKVVSESYQPTFNYTVGTKVSTSKTRIPVSLKMMDNDTAPNADEIADINPLPGQDVLTLSYEPSTGAIYGPDNRKLGMKGQTISVKGDRDKRGVEITFTITHKDALATTPQLPQDPSCPVAATNCQVK